MRDPPHALSVAAQQLIAAAGLILATVALLLGLHGDPSSADVVRATAAALVVALPIGVGLFALNRDRNDRFARLLVIAGFAWAPAMLAFSDATILYSIGRVWGWLQELALIYLFLAMPIGRLTTRPERFVFGWAVLLVAGFFIPFVLFAEFPNPSPWTSCVSSCPDNAFMLTNHDSATITSLTSLRGFLTVAAYLGAALVVAQRIVQDRRVVRVYGPALVVAFVHCVAAVCFFILRDSSPSAGITETVGLVALVTMPLLILAFFAGLVHWRFVARNAWSRLGPDVPGGANRIRALVRDALGDPSVELGFWHAAHHRWIDEAGWPFALPPLSSTRGYTEIISDGRPVAVFVHEASHVAEATIRDLVRGVALMALENQRLEAAMHASTRELRESRARIMAAIDKDRLRIERDLHDGAQQRLIALKVAADLGAETLLEDPVRAADLFRRIGDDADRALDEVRSLARGVYPPLLIDFGLVASLNDASSRLAVPAVVRARNVGRYPPEIEAAVYFCCLEALQNAEKHAGARSVTITLIADRTLQFEVRDNGCGFDSASDAAGGAGLSNMRERVAAVDGKLRVDSVVGAGTRIGGVVPLAPDHLPPEVERLVLNASDALQGAMGIYKAVRTASGTIVDFAVEHVNDSACRMTGLSRQSQVGRTLSQLDPAYRRSSGFRWHCEALEAGETLVREEAEYAWTAAGRRLQVAYEVRAVGMGAGRLALLWNDITTRKRGDRELAFRAEAVSREGDGVCVVRAATGAIALANESFERMMGYEAGELEGRDSSELRWREARGHDKRVDGAKRIVRGRRKDGATIWTELTATGFDDPDLGWCWVSVHRDISASREAEELGRLRSLRLAEALRGLPLLAYSADHDLTCTLLVDNLIDPLRRDLPRSGPDADLFGPVLADHIASLNRRVLVTGTSASTTTSLGARARIAISVDPVLGDDGEILGIVGRALADEEEDGVNRQTADRPQRARARVFSRLR